MVSNSYSWSSVLANINCHAARHAEFGIVREIMSDVKRTTAPFDKDVVKTLKAGDNVLISGYIIAVATQALTEAGKVKTSA